MYDMGVPPREIAAKEGVPVDSIRGIAKRYRVQKSAKVHRVLGARPLFLKGKKELL